MKCFLSQFFINLAKGLTSDFLSIFKVHTKKYSLPKDADSVFFAVAPVINICVAMLVFLLIPFSEKAAFANVEAGLFLVFVVLCLDVFGCIMAGIGSNTRNAVIGSLRAARQIINSRLVAFSSVIPVVISSHSLKFADIVDAQRDMWFVFPHILTFIGFVFSMIAFMMLKPLNFSDGTTEITGGYRSEYSGLSLMLFDLGDILSMLAVAAFVTVMFLGGWLPIGGALWLLKIPQFVWFVLKIALCLVLMMFIKYTTPRFREDQLLGFLWKFIFPINVFWSFFTAGYVVFNG
ncbi:MAG: NADH-quinone oxidoreductase subunit H [Alphaproteobacteria bacterium]